MLLPIIASPEDVLQLISFLKTKATGCTIEDARAVVDNKLLDPRKINAYLIWGLVVRDGDRIKLSELGKRASRISSNDYSDIFSEVLQSIAPYHNALEWLFYQKDINIVTNVDIAAYWYETKKFGMNGESENTLKDMAICFFKVCESAGIGKLVIGRRGQATRMEIDRDAIGQYVGGSSIIKSSLIPQENPDDDVKEGAPLAEEKLSSDNSPETIEIKTTRESSTTTEETRIFISHGQNMEIVEQIKTLIELANLDYEIAVENETSAIPIPDKVFGAMRRCNSAVICISKDEREKKDDGRYGVNQNVLIEIGSAFVLYDKRVILVWDKCVDIPSNLQGLYRCEYTGDELSWGTGIKLMKVLNDFKKTK